MELDIIHKDMKEYVHTYVLEHMSVSSTEIMH